MTRKAVRSAAFLLVPFITGILVVLTAYPCGAAGEEQLVTLRYAPEEGKVLKYKGDSRKQVYYGPYSFETITGQEVEISLLEKLENGHFRMSVSFIKSSTKMMRMGDLIEQEPPQKPEGQ